MSEKYLHGYTTEEQKRLQSQAEFLYNFVYKDIDYSGCKKLLEVGCGVGSQTQILLEKFPEISVTGIDISEEQIKQAKSNLSDTLNFAWRYDFICCDANHLPFESDSFDSAFLCWVLEHINNPEKVMNEINRVLMPESKIYITEVFNHSLFLHPEKESIKRYWKMYNKYQSENGGDPDIGVKIGNILRKTGFKNIEMKPLIRQVDTRNIEERNLMFDYWLALLLSGKNNLLNAKMLDNDLIFQLITDFEDLKNDKESIFFYNGFQWSCSK